jgi:hypothetical protein
MPTMISVWNDEIAHKQSAPTVHAFPVDTIALHYHDNRQIECQLAGVEWQAA